MESHVTFRESLEPKKIVRIKGLETKPRGTRTKRETRTCRRVAGGARWRTSPSSNTRTLGPAQFYFIFINSRHVWRGDLERALLNARA